MRRSKAPSVLNKAKRIGRNNSDSDSEEQYGWGSGSCKPKSLKNRRIFNVLWRDVSTRKHKVWKGDGFLEVDICNLKAILKDETGKYIGCSTKVNINGLVPDFQMIISGKEVEIQNEIEDDDELQNLSKIQVENFNNEGCAFVKDNPEEAKKPKGGFMFKPVLVLKSPKLAADEQTTENANFSLEWNCTKIRKNCEFSNEFICFLKPTELQQFIFQKVFTHLYSRKPDSIQSSDVELVLKLVCNHPSLINHKTTTNELLRHLIPALPDWAEMGPFDSAKLEFVQYFLTDLTRSNPQNCIILAKNPNVINMLQGLCDFMKIECLRLNSSTCQSVEPKNCSSHVILVDSLHTLNCSEFSILCKKIIVFEEYVEFSNISSVVNVEDVSIYYLVTAFSIEELYLLDTYTNIIHMLNDLNIMNQEYDCCFLHSKIECNCFESADRTLNTENAFIKHWYHFKPPFDLQLLKVCSLDNLSENIVSIFCKKR